MWSGAAPTGVTRVAQRRPAASACTFDFGTALATELKWFTYCGAGALLVGSVTAALVLAPALRQRTTWDSLGQTMSPSL